MTSKSKKCDANYPPTEGGVSGWFAVLGCCLYHLISSTVGRSFGVVVVAWQRTHPYPSLASLVGVGSLTMFLNDGLGPVVAAAINKGVTPRLLIIVASFFFIGGALASAFVASVTSLYFTYGLCIGVGGGLAFNASYISVVQHFQRRLPLAAALLFLGGGVGGIAMPPLMEYLADEFGLRGMMIVVAGILAHNFVVAALTRPIEDSYPDGIGDGIEGAGAGKRRESETGRVHDETRTCCRNDGFVGDVDDAVARRSSIPDCGGTENNGKNRRENLDEHLRKETVQNFKEEDNKSAVEELATDSDNNECLLLGLNVFVLRDPVYVFFVASVMMGTAIGVWSPVYLPLLAVERGVAEMDAALLVSYEYVAQIVAILASGFALNLPAVSRFWRPIGVAALVLTGVVDFVLPSLDAYRYYAACAVVHGVVHGVFVVIRAPLLVDLMGRRHLQSLFGIYAFVMGVGFLAMPAIGGALVDRFRRQDAAFYFHGAANMAAAASLTASCVLRSRSNV